MSAFLNRHIGPILMALWAVLAVADLLLRNSTAIHSGDGALSAALGISLLMWPLTMGLAAATTVRPMRPHLRDIVNARPDAARVRLVMRPVAILTGWSVVGLFSAALVCVLIVGANGSWVAWPAYSALVATAAGTVMVTFLGGALGLLFPSWIIPPVVAVAAYLSLLPQWGVVELLTNYMANISDPLIIPVFSSVAWVTLICLTLGIVMLLLSILRLTMSRRIGALTLGAGLLWILFVGLNVDNIGGYRDLPEEFWSCAALPATGSEVCVPGEQTSHLSETLTSLTAIDAKVVESFPAGTKIQYNPIIASKAHTLPISIPYGVPVPYSQYATYEEDAANTIAMHLSDCTSLGKYPNDPDAAFNDEDSFVDLSRYMGFLLGRDITIAVPNGETYSPMTTAEAQAFVTLAQKGCNAQ